MDDIKKFLDCSQYIDCDNGAIKSLSNQLAKGRESDKDIAKSCFHWVRDNIKHSVEFQMNPVTCKASDVLKFKTGYCYAKSHLLAALLRANKIPAGLCYQRLSVDDKGAPYCLHGLNAVYLKDYGWYRMDARGNNNNVNAQFSPPQEQLAYPIRLAEEAEVPGIWVEPLPAVTSVLEKYDTYDEVYYNLPDVDFSSKLFSHNENK